MRKVVRRPSPAMVVAIAGLIVAATGDAGADGVKAVASVVGKDQVTSRSVKDNSLRLVDVRPAERVKLRGRQGPRGPKGDAGLPLDKVFRKSATFEVAVAQCGASGTPPNTCAAPITQIAAGTVVCDPGRVASGGGVTPDNAQDIDVKETHPTADGTGWTATIGSDDTASPHKFEITVLCVPGTAS